MSAVVEFPEIKGRAWAAAGGDDVERHDGDEPHLQVVADEPVGDLIAWTPERAAALMRGFGLALHTLDPATELDGGADLWRATSTEATEIGAPLSRILARYEPARKLAGVVDEAELGAAFVSYAKRNMRDRGRVVLAAKDERGEPFGSAD